MEANGNIRQNICPLAPNSVHFLDTDCSASEADGNVYETVAPKHMFISWQQDLVAVLANEAKDREKPALMQERFPNKSAVLVLVQRRKPGSIPLSRTKLFPEGQSTCPSP